MDVLAAYRRIDSSLVYAVNKLFEPDSRLFELVGEVRAFLVGASQNQGAANDRWRETDLSQPGLDPVAALESSPWVEGTWAECELERVVLVFPHVESSIHEHNPLVQQLANFLCRKTRSVEAQLLMCRNLQRDSQYPWGNMNRLIPEIWERRNEIWEHGLAGIRPDGTVDADYVPGTPDDTPTSGEPTHAEAEGDPPASVPPQPGSPFSPGDRVASNDGVLNGTVSWCWNNGTVEVRLDDGETRIFTCTALTLADQQDEIVDADGGDSVDTQVIETPADTGTQFEDDMIDSPPESSNDNSVAPPHEPPTVADQARDPIGPFSRLLERSFGGKDVAIAPDDNIHPFWPTGPAAAGAMDVCDRLASHLREGPRDKVAEWVFLVGGAGNGKSFLANYVVTKSDCKLDQAPQEHHSRVYLYRSPKHRRFRLINDATIPPDDNSQTTKQHPSLCADLAEALDAKQDVLACVNRGILIGEQQELKESDSNSVLPKAIDSLLNWLITAEIANSTGQENDGQHTRLQMIKNSDGTVLSLDEGYYAVSELAKDDTVVARIHLLNMDYASLFEPVPRLQQENDRSIHWDEETDLPDIARYDVLEFGRGTEARRQSPAFRVLRDLIEQFNDIEVQAVADPILANLSMLRNEEICQSLIEIFRAAEIVSGQRFTYRELWGLFCIALTGYVRDEFVSFGDDRVPPETWYDKESDKQYDDELFFLVGAAMQRTHMSLFGGEIPSLKQWVSLPRFEPHFPSASRWPKEVDPALDTLRDWAEDVHQAMMSIRLSENQKPSEYLFNRQPQIEFAWHAFDTRLENVILERIRDKETKDPDKRMLQRWYGSYLFRIYGLVLGKPAFADTVSEWTENWRAARRQQSPSRRFSRGLETLLTGGSADQAAADRVYLPLLAARTTPISSSSKATIAAEYPIRDFRDFVIKVRGDNLELFLHGLDNSQGTTRHGIIVDFSLCRDALCCSSGHLGFTNNSHRTAPRVERIRASLLSEARGAAASQQLQQPKHGIRTLNDFHVFKSD